MKYLNLLNKRGILFICIVMVFSSMTLFPGNEALWLRYPAISPDGETIAFCYQGDIFTVSKEGGVPKALTRHNAYDFMPAWSTDGRTIAFASDRFGNFDVYVIAARGGKAKRLTFHSANDYPSDFSPDGSAVLFRSSRMDSQKSTLFPRGGFTELYRAAVKGGLPEQILTTPAEDARWDRAGKRILYHDNKGYEDSWRKHHKSSVTRDVWLYDSDSGKHTQLTDFAGEDRSPAWSADGQNMYYLSEKDGSFNVWRMPLSDPGNPLQVTYFKKHPVRFLSASQGGDLCFGFNGEIYLLPKGAKQPYKVRIPAEIDVSQNTRRIETVTSGATEMCLSPNGKEIAFIVRGEVFVTAVDYPLTKRITGTPEQERSVSFSPDGRKLLFAAEMGRSWNLYQVSIKRKEESYFYNSTLLLREPLLVSDKETFQPAYSPDGKEVAYLEERTTLRILNLRTKKSRTVLSGDKNYSYSDGDQWYDWSPDSKYLLVRFLDTERWGSEVGLVDASGTKALVNLTNCGYSDVMPKWMMAGKMMIWVTDKHGLRNHGPGAPEGDIYGMFFTRETFDRFKLSKAEYDLLKEEEEENEEAEEKEKTDKKKKKKKAKKIEPLRIDLKNIEDRVARLTIHSSRLADAALSPDGETLAYLSRFEKGYDLWVHKLREKKTRLLAKLGAQGGSLTFDEEGENIFVLYQGKIVKIELESGKQKPVTYAAEMNLDLPGERDYLFEHVWRQVQKKFYVKDLHGVDWSFYKENYQRFLPHISNNWDFTEMLSEMLGELNGSHTGSGNNPDYQNPDSTAALGAFCEASPEINGLKVLEIIEKGPLARADSKIKPGVIIKKINGTPVTPGMNYYPLLNRQAGKTMLLTLTDPASGKEWEETIKPIESWRQRGLLYNRWIRTRRAETERLSKGRLGYVHIRSMGDFSFRETFSEVFGRHSHKEGIVVDTRFNGGGWLHDELVTMFSGKKYFTFVPRGQVIGIEPGAKWIKSSVVVMGEDNYSNAHMFPYVYKELGIGKLVGMPVAGTGTAVWWESLQDRSLHFGIPQVGIKGINGKYLENRQLEPDYLVKNDPETTAAGRDKQLEKAVEVLLTEIDKKSKK